MVTGFSDDGWLIFLAVGLAGACSGAWCVRFSYAYIAVLDAGNEPDPQCFSDAWLAALKLRVSALQCWPAALLSAGMVLVWVVYGLSFYFFGLAIALAVLLALALIDAATGLLPDALTLPLLWLGLAMAWMGQGVSLSDAVAGAMAAYAALWLLGWLCRVLWRREGMGYGDLKLFAALGAWLGWQPLAWVMLAASLIAIVFSMGHQRTLRPRGAYPFGPFMAAAAVPALLGNSGVQSWF